MLYEVGHADAAARRGSWAIWRPTIEGLENILPPTASWSRRTTCRSPTPSMLPMVVPRKVVFLARRTTSPAPASGHHQPRLVRVAGLHPGRPRQHDLGHRVSRHRAQGARQRRAFGIYPEGCALARRPALPRTHRCRVQLALTSGAPITPGGSDGHRQTAADRCLDAADWQGHRPLRYADHGRRPLRGDAPGKAQARADRRGLMTAIQALSGQEPAGVYNERTPTARSVGRGRLARGPTHASRAAARLRGRAGRGR